MNELLLLLLLQEREREREKEREGKWWSHLVLTIICE